jgi:hypothetical protein
MVPNSNPIILDGSGRAPTGIWLPVGNSFTFVTTTAGGAVVSTMTNVMAPITVAPSSLSPCSNGGGAGSPSELQFYSTPTALGCSPNLTWDTNGMVLGVTGTTGQASITSYSGYFQSYEGYLSTVPGGGSWNAFNSPTDGAALKGYFVSQTATNNAGGYIDVAPISYNPYNGSQCIDAFGNVVQQPLPLNGSSGFGPNDSLIWVGTSPAMPSNGSCGIPLPVSPSQTYAGVGNQSFGLFTNSYFFPRGGVATDNAAFNAFQALNGGAYLHLGLTTDQAVYPKAYAASTSLNNPGTGYGGLAYQGGSVYYYYNQTSGTWGTVNFASGGGGGGSANGPANAIQTNDPAGAGAFTGYSWLIANVSSQSITALGGFTTTSGAGACALFNCIQAPVGGLYAGLGVTTDQALYPKAFATTSGLNSPASGYGGITYAGASVGSGATYRYYNASTAAWATVDFSASGSGCTLGGTATGQVIFNLSGSCTSSSNLAWNNSTQALSIVGATGTSQALTIAGFALASDGFNSGTCSAATCIQSPNGGLSAGLGVTAGQGFYSFNFAPVGGAAPGSLNNPATGYGGIAYAGSGLYWAWNGSSWYSWTPGSGGGGGTCPGSPATSIQFNNGGSACGGSANFTFSTGTNQVSLASGTFLTSGVSAGFNASTCTAANCVQAPSGGMLAQNLALSVPSPSGLNYPIITMFTSASSRARIMGPGPLSTVGNLFLSVNGNINGGSIFADVLNQGVPMIRLTSNSGATGDAIDLLTSLPSANPLSSQTIAINVINSGNVGIQGAAATGAGQSFNVTGVTGVAGINLTNGFMQSDGGYFTASTVYNSVHSFGGFRANESNCTPLPGCLSTGAFTVLNTKVIDYAGNVYANVLNLTAITGSTQCLQANSAGLVSGTGSACGSSGGAFLPLAGGTMTGSIVMSSGTTVNSLTTGATVAFQAGSGNFQAFGNGNINGANINAATSFEINGSTVINNLSTFFPSGIIDSGGATIGGTLVVTGVTTATAGLISHAAIGATAYNIVNGSGAFLNGGVTCSGINAATYQSVGGITTHCAVNEPSRSISDMLP